MPTSAGKTMLAEFNIVLTKSLRKDAKVVYIVPSRALVNQVYFDLRQDLSAIGFNVERTSSASEIDPTEADFLIADDVENEAHDWNYLLLCYDEKDQMLNICFYRRSYLAIQRR